MSNENKTALTAEIPNHIEAGIEARKYATFEGKLDGLVELAFYNGTVYLREFFDKYVELASLQTKEKDKEIAELKAQRIVDIECISKSGSYRMDSRKQIESLQSTIESQQKEIEEFKRAIEDEKKTCLRVMDYNSDLQSQLDEVTKERESKQYPDIYYDNGINWIVTDENQYHYKVSIGRPFIIDGKRYLVNEYANGVIYLTYMPLPI